MTRALKDRIAELERQGFTVISLRHNKHVTLTVLSPAGNPSIVVVSATPSDRLLGKKFRAQLRRLARPQ